jgi:hypothetical protein
MTSRNAERVVPWLVLAVLTLAVTALVLSVSVALLAAQVREVTGR